MYAATGNNWNLDGFCYGAQRDGVGAGEGAVAGDVGEDNATAAELLHRLGEMHGGNSAGFLPAGDGDHAFTCVEAENDGVAEFGEHLLRPLRLVRRFGADDAPEYSGV